MRLLALVRGETLAKVRDQAVDEVHVWPHLLRREMLAALAATIALWVVSLGWDAPLEEIANPTHTPNPAKAPWYFAGLQELLVYFDPWIAGVMLPGLVLLGLCAIPYLDPNRAGAGGYAFRQRPVAVGIFTFGLFLWFTLIFIGVLCRGPSWAWYWPWEDWSVHKPPAGLAVNLPPAVGIPLVVAYLAIGGALPYFVSRRAFRALSPARYVITVGLLLLMIAVPLKILLRLLFNVKYLLVTPWFNV